MPKLLFSSAGSDPNALSYKGLWTTGTHYPKNSQVGNNGDLFVCIEAHTAVAGNEPGTGASWQTYWARSVDMLSADQVAACAGTGTPSASNKFVTEDVFTAGTPFVVKEVVKNATATLTVAECSNTIISNYGQSADMTLTLPTAAAGLSFVFTVTTIGHAVNLKAGASDKIYLDGVALSDGYKVSCASPNVGDAIIFYSFKADATSYDWIAHTQTGTWINGGA